ncbi:MAG TPA: CoA pyrophosphatase [Polyangiaceae bacterium]|nr:CoA pyrophosphatase [Polyangiaceae bacterium]
MIGADQVRAALARHRRVDMPALPGRTNHLESGILVPLMWQQDRLWCIATLRTDGLREHAGEVCFPGGRPEPGDQDLTQTALREAHEELGIADAEILGPLSSIPLYTSDYRLRPWVAAVPSQELVPNPAEVARVLRLDVGEQLSRSHIDAIPWTHPDTGASYSSPVFSIDDVLMYGATAHTFRELLEVLAPLLGATMPTLETGRFTWQDVLGVEPKA